MEARDSAGIQLTVPRVIDGLMIAEGLNSPVVNSARACMQTRRLFPRPLSWKTFALQARLLIKRNSRLLRVALGVELAGAGGNAIGVNAIQSALGIGIPMLNDLFGETQ